jgi:hypothetical protein
MARLTGTRTLLTGLWAVAVLTIVALVLSVVAQSNASDAQAKAARLAKVQAEQAAYQAKLVRDAICGTFVDVARQPITPKVSELGRRLIRDTDRGATVAGCPR